MAAAMMMMPVEAVSVTGAGAAALLPLRMVASVSAVTMIAVLWW